MPKLRSSADVLSPVALINLFEPPAGHSFDSGIWFTHDLNGTVLGLRVAPALLGVLDMAAARRWDEVLSAPGGTFGRRFVVFHAAHRTVGYDERRIWATPPWVGLVGVDRLHAKFGLLRYRAEFGSGKLVRAVVTSGNLTPGGVGRNREVHLWEDGKPAGPLARDLARVAADFLATRTGRVQAEQHSIEQASAILDAIVAPGQRPTSARRVVHSMTEQRSLIDVGLPPGRAERVVVVSPAFSGDDDATPLELLEERVGVRTRFELYAPMADIGGTRRPVASTAVCQGATDAGAQLRVFGVGDGLPVDGAALGPERALHAKLVATEDAAGTADVLVGSANFTRRGIGGVNRELMARVTMTGDELTSFLGQLDGKVHRSWHAAPTDQEDPESEPAPFLSAVFTPDEGQSWAAETWLGEIEVDFDERPVGLTYQGGAVPRRRETQPFRFARVPEAPLVAAYRSGQQIDWAISLAGLDRLEELPADEEEEESRFLAELQRAEATRRERRRLAAGGGLPAKDLERVDLASHHPLAILVRYRQTLWHLVRGQDARRLIERELEGEDKAVIRCALAIAAAGESSGEVQDDYVLAALSTALARLGRAGR